MIKAQLILILLLMNLIV